LRGTLTGDIRLKGPLNAVDTHADLQIARAGAVWSSGRDGTLLLGRGERASGIRGA
jgi:hypothetical protein